MDIGFIRISLNRKIIVAVRLYDSCIKPVGIRLPSHCHSLSAFGAVGGNHVVSVRSYVRKRKSCSVTRLAVTGLIIFVLGIMLNEIVLMIQGVAALSYNSIPHTNEILLGIALVMFSGILLVNWSQMKLNHIYKKSFKTAEAILKFLFWKNHELLFWWYLLSVLQAHSSWHSQCHYLWLLHSHIIRWFLWLVRSLLSG